MRHSRSQVSVVGHPPVTADVGRTRAPLVGHVADSDARAARCVRGVDWGLLREQLPVVQGASNVSPTEDGSRCVISRISFQERSGGAASSEGDLEGDVHARTCRRGLDLAAFCLSRSVSQGDKWGFCPGVSAARRQLVPTDVPAPARPRLEVRPEPRRRVATSCRGRGGDAPPT